MMKIHSLRARAFDAIKLPLLACAMFMPFASMAQTFSHEYSMVGPAVRTRPAYDGSKSQELELVPVIRYYGTPWFVRSTRGVLEGGARHDIAPGFALGAQVAFEPGRSPDEADFLRNRNVVGVNPGASWGVHAELDTKIGPVPVDFLWRLRKHADSDRGMQNDFRITAGVFEKGGFAAGVFAQGTWGNDKSTGSFYSITPAQAPITGLPAYNAEGGLLFTSVGLLWSYDLTQKWVVVGNMERRRLHGDAAASPLTERKSNYYAAVGVAYRF